MALDDPDLPVLVETEWDVSSCRWDYETTYGNVPVVGLRIEDGAIFFDAGEPTYCATCKHAGIYEGPDGKLYCGDCHRRVGEVDDDLVRDVTEVLTSMCVRLYGRRSAARRAERAMEAAAA